MSSQFETHADEEALVIDVGQLGQSLKRHAKVILAGTMIGLLGSAAFATFLYQPKYKSEATVLFSSSQNPTVVSDYEIASPLSGKNRDNNLRNQEALLHSHKVAEAVLKELQHQKIKSPAKNSQEMLDKVLTFKYVSDTDFIKIGAEAPNPKQARKIAAVYLDTYKKIVRELTLEPLTQQQARLKKQTHSAEVELDRLSAELQKYQEQFGIVSIADEGQLKVRSLENLKVDLKASEANLSEKTAEIAKIRSQLQLKGMDVQSAIQAVAAGQDRQLVSLESDLQEAEREYARMGQIYAPTNPDMKQLEGKIAKLKSQLADQHILSVGMSSTPKAGVYGDSVRGDLVARLASSEAQQAALKNRLGTMHRQVSQLEGSLKQLPVHQLEYLRLSNAFESQQDVLAKMREKLAEVNIQQAAVQESLTEIDQPTMPRKPVSMPGWQIVLMSSLFAFGLSSASVLGLGMMRPQGVRPFFMENIARIPVLSVIPWTSQAAYQRCRTRNTLEVLMSPVDADVLKAYQDFALNLKARRDAEGKQALTVASLTQDAQQSVVLGNLAYCLAQSGERVVVVDTNLRSPRLHDTFGQSLNFDRGLTELINSLSETLYHKPDASTEDLIPVVESGLLPSGIHPQLHYVNAGVRLDNTFEFLNSKGFAALVKVLKSHYDWVLFDAPPFLTSPDAAVELGYMDGLLLLVEKEATETQLQQVSKKVVQLNSTIVGSALRLGEE